MGVSSSERFPSPVQRVVIVGCAGAGKTIFAQQLGKLLRLPVIHLDALFWQPGWVKPTDEEWEQKIDRLLQSPRWIMDGQYVFLDKRIRAADMVVFLKISRWLCLWRIIKRWGYHRKKDRLDRAPQCSERISWGLIQYTWTFAKKRHQSIQDIMNQHQQGRYMVILMTPRAVKSWLKQWQAKE